MVSILKEGTVSILLDVLVVKLETLKGVFVLDVEGVFVVNFCIMQQCNRVLC